jgi:L-aminopeptidase/D-esterase-like protein
VPGIQVGHTTIREVATGCTVVLCPEGATAGVDVRGSAPGTRETDLLRPGNLVQNAHAILLSGGSAFGLDAASGVMKFLEERKVGYQIGPTHVPIVPAAILFDLGLISHSTRPGPQEGYQACINASDGPVEEGSVGAGTGATVGKIKGMSHATKGGIGTASIRIQNSFTVGAIAAVNAMGDVVDYEKNRILAGPRREDGKGFYRTTELLTALKQETNLSPSSNTTLVVVATNASLTKEQANKLAQVAHDGMALAIRPCHTMSDGDITFALATGKETSTVEMNPLCTAATLVVAQAIMRAILQADGLGGVPAAKELSYS